MTTFTNEEIKALYDVISELSGGNPENLFAWDGNDDINDPTISATVKIFKMCDKKYPANLNFDKIFCDSLEKELSLISFEELNEGIILETFAKISEDIPEYQTIDEDNSSEILDKYFRICDFKLFKKIATENLKLNLSDEKIYSIVDNFEYKIDKKLEEVQIEDLSHEAFIKEIEKFILHSLNF